MPHQRNRMPQSKTMLPFTQPLLPALWIRSEYALKLAAFTAGGLPLSWSALLKVSLVPDIGKAEREAQSH